MHYPTENRKKRTAIHAKVLCGEETEIFEFPEVPEYSSEGDVLLLFPKEGAKQLKEVKDLEKVKKLVVIDSQWQTAKKILSHPNLQQLPCVSLDTHQTLFWRYHPKNVDDSGLATIEAIFYFFREYHLALHPSYEGQYDDLLYFFAHNYKLIQSYYKSNNLEFKKKKNYIK